LSAGLRLSEGRSRAEHGTIEKMSKHTAKTKLSRAETVMHSDTDWKPDNDSEEYESSGKYIHRESKKGDTILLSISSLNID